MAKITPESIAKLKALFQDNEKALGSNFSQLIDFFNNNKVTDNGDGTFSVGNTIINVNDIVQEPEIQSIIRSQLIYSPDFATKSDVTTAVSAATANKQDKIGYTPADDSKVVHDNHDGTEQLNGTKVQPFNKLSDSVGGRNYLLKSDQPITVSDGGTNNRYAIIPTKLKTLSAGTYIFTANVSGLVGNQTSLSIGFVNPNSASDFYGGDVPIVNGTVTKKMYIKDGDIHTNIIIYSGPGAWKGSAGCTAVYTNYQLIKSDVVKDWTPAPEDKVTDNHDGTEQLNGTKVQPFNKLSDTIGGRNLATNLGDVLVHQ